MLAACQHNMHEFTIMKSAPFLEAIPIALAQELDGHVHLEFTTVLSHSSLPTLPGRHSADRLDGQLVPVEERLGLRAREDAFGRPYGPDAARAHGAGELEALELGTALQQAQDVASIEGIAST